MSRRRRLWPWLVVPALIVAAGVAYLLGRFPEAVSDGSDRLRLLYLVGLVVLVGGSVVVHWRLRPGQALRNAALWVAIGTVLLAGYSYRHEALRLKDRLVGELLPHRGVAGGGAIRFPAAAGGHFIVEADVDGTPVRFLVDTGASDVVLTPADAARLGFDVDGLNYSRRYRTAAGVVFGAPVRLRRMSIGPVTLTDVRASVNRAAMRHSLLGMSFLGRLAGYEVTGDTLILRP